MLIWWTVLECGGTIPPSLTMLHSQGLDRRTALLVCRFVIICGSSILYFRQHRRQFSSASMWFVVEHNAKPRREPLIVKPVSIRDARRTCAFIEIETGSRRSVNARYILAISPYHTSGECISFLTVWDDAPPRRTVPGRPGVRFYSKVRRI